MTLPAPRSRPSTLQAAGRRAAIGAGLCNRARHGRTATDRRAGRDLDPGQNAGAEPDQRAVADRDVAAEHAAWREVCPRADLAIMLDDRTGVDDRAFAEDGAEIDGGMRHDERAVAERDRAAQGSVGVNERGQAVVARGDVLLDTLAQLIVADSDEAIGRVRVELATALVAAMHPPAPGRRQPFVIGIEEEHLLPAGLAGGTHRFGAVRGDPAVTAGAEDKQRPGAGNASGTPRLRK